MKSRQWNFLGCRDMFIKVNKLRECKSYKRINITKIAGLAVIMVILNNTVMASAPYSFFNQEKPSYFNDYLVKEKIINKSLKTNLTLEDKQRLANYEKQYLDEYQRLMQQKTPLKEFYVQPINKVESCKIWVLISHDYSNELLTGFRHYWDGACKNGYADGIGREFVKADKHDAWVLANYQDGVPTYYAKQNKLGKTYIEGVFDVNDLIWQGVESYSYKETIMKSIGTQDYRTKINLLETFFIDTPEILFVYKEYPNFKYQKIEYGFGSSSRIDYEFSLYDQNNKRNGWGFYKTKSANYFGNFEYIDDKPTLLPLPTEFRQKYGFIMDEIHWAVQLALKAQKKALKVKQKYINQYCHQPSQTMLKVVPEYMEICTDDEY